jgi:uncharacterized protein YgiM (DUF1202 family)
LQDDVVELCNKIEVEYKELCIARPELFNYISQVEQEVKTAAGLILAQQISEESGEEGETESTEEGGDAGLGETETSEETGPVYATTTATVNVRSSDSETADKINKVSANTQVQVLEQRANGWTKILYGGKEGFIKSQYLSIAESASDAEVIGTVTAITTVNVRLTASTTATKLGVVAEGESLSLVANDGEWCKVIYNGQIGYVKAEYVQ